MREKERKEKTWYLTLLNGVGGRESLKSHEPQFVFDLIRILNAALQFLFPSSPLNLCSNPLWESGKVEFHSPFSSSPHSSPHICPPCLQGPGGAVSIPERVLSA